MALPAALELVRFHDAVELARRLHAGQLDKAGRPYIAHPLRVAVAVTRMGGDEVARMAAVLHDVVEDAGVSFEDLVALGASADLVATIDAVTRRPGETYADFVARAAASPRSALVKLADIEDNLDEDRLALLAPDVASSLRRRYRKARATIVAAHPELASLVSP